MKTLTTKPSLQKDVYYATLFNQITSEDTWLRNKAFAPGGWAVDYCFLYTMYRALNAAQPRNIIELGLGQTTHMLSQYKEYVGASLTTCEHDEDWIKFFKTQSTVHLDIEKMELSKRDEYEIGTLRFKPVNVYSNFKEIITKNDKKYDFIVIDAPFGGTEPYSRVHILDLIYLQKVADSFVIMIDDLNRKGELNTFKKAQEMLKDNGFKIKSQIYSGEKEHGIIVSENLRFLCSM